MNNECEDLVLLLKCWGIVFRGILIFVLGFFTGIGIGWAIDNLLAIYF